MKQDGEGKVCPVSDGVFTYWERKGRALQLAVRQKNNGAFVLRIEDTDLARTQEKFERLKKIVEVVEDHLSHLSRTHRVGSKKIRGKGCGSLFAHQGGAHGETPRARA